MREKQRLCEPRGPRTGVSTRKSDDLARGPRTSEQSEEVWGGLVWGGYEEVWGGLSASERCEAAFLSEKLCESDN